MKLLAISDLHLAHRANREALPTIGHHPDDWLILAGDTGERVESLAWALDLLAPRFARIIWTPGNHDLWSPPHAEGRTHGQARYDELVATCRARGVLTPEDPYVRWPGAPETFIAPLFLLYDYSFRPSDVPASMALDWAREHGIVCGDERWLDPSPWPDRIAWCHARCDATEARLAALPADSRTVLVSHWPLRYDLARPPRVPRFSLWCGTTRTEDWPVRFRARAVVNGHLHMRTTMWRDGIRHEEVSLGYPRDWRAERGVAFYLREILPAPDAARSRFVPPRDPFV
ncbi:MAG: metallophosphoesterase [Vicinamibacterales bacterium]